MAKQQANGLPRMIRGSVVTQRRRCGKPNCHCADGTALHESTALSYSTGGRNRTVMLEAGEVAAVLTTTPSRVRGSWRATPLVRGFRCAVNG